MKKIITIFSLVLSLFSMAAFSQQGTICNAVFSFSVNGYVAQFTPVTLNTSALLEHEWSFGDGTGNAFNASPVHQYSAAGIYTVVHTVLFRSPNDSTIVSCTDSFRMNVAISGQPACNLAAYFTFERDSTIPYRLSFYNQSTGTDSNTNIRWTFGDGTASELEHPVHIYQRSGAYNVCLRVSNDSTCFSDTCMIIQVQAPDSSCNLQAYFTSTADSLNPLIVRFQNQSFPADPTDSVRYSFGDGTASFDQNPTHTYTSPGTYNVCIRVKKFTTPGTPVCVDEYCRMITVQAACDLNAAFTYFRDSIETNTLYFSNLSTGVNATTAVLWNFGDGTSSTDFNPDHVYTNSGAYAVCLTITNDSLCTRTTCFVVEARVPGDSCYLNAHFIYSIDSIQTNTVQFYNQSTGVDSNTTVRWTFGDGTASELNYPVHTYQQSGAYTVCLRLRNDNTCVSDTCMTIQVQVPNSVCNTQAFFTTTRDSLNPLVVHFQNQTAPADPTDSVRYTFGDGSSSFQNNPTHTYNVAGTYRVCIRVKKVTLPGTAPCVREYCQTIEVRQAPPACNLDAYFVYSIDSIQTHTLQFSNLSSGTDSNTRARWTFGDGTAGDGNYPVHTYTASGLYTVCLRVQRDSSCYSDTCMNVQVQLPVSCNLSASFQYAQDSLTNNTIQFYNTSTPYHIADSIRWSFGDGSSSTAINPGHTYNNAGSYNVCIRVQRFTAPGTAPCVREYCSVVEIARDSCNQQANFTSRIDSANNRRVIFINSSVSNTSTAALWTFGDGTSSNSWNAEHLYAAPGRYAVCLSVIEGNCTSTFCDSILITGTTAPPANCDSARLEFVYRQDTYMPNKYFFFATSNRPLVAQQWTFTNWTTGDTVQVNQFHPIHVFTDTGYYNVCVRGTFANGCVKEYCEPIRVNSVTTPVQCIVQAFPNPAHNHVAVNLQLQEPATITASVYNIQSILMLVKTQQGFTGNNLVDLNISNLAPGFYTIRLNYGNKTCYSRFQKF